MLSQTTYGSEQLFYYSFDKKVLIEEVPGKLMIKKKSDISQAEMETIIRSYVDEPTISWFNSDICTVSVEDILVEQTITHLIQEESVLSARHIYNTSTGKHYYEGRKNHRALDIGLIDQLVLKYKEGVSLTVKDNLNNTYGLTKYKQNELFGLYTISKKSDILSISNILFETGYFEYVYPELICKYTLFEERTFYPNDTYFQYQVTLHNTGQSFNGHYGTADADIDAPEAWAVTMGNEDIVIAVIDQGVTSNHPDLPNTRQVRLNGSNIGSGSPNDPSPTGNENHGNACAGIIAATINNNEGIAGIAPLCKIMPIRFDDSNTPSEMADAIRFAANNGADVISNSWGYDDPDMIVSAITDAIQYAISKDCVVMFAAGNTANHSSNDNGYVCFPANQTISGMLSVGASDRYDQQADYSPTSPLIDIVAPSHRAYPYNSLYYSGIIGENLDMWSIDIPGSDGYNSWHTDQGDFFNTGDMLPTTGTNYLSYTGHFGGTSHACPVVAGVAALVLSMNPDLSPQIVCSILTASADKVGGYTYVNDKCDNMGYGRVNAYNAVWMACDTTKLVGDAPPHHYTVHGTEDIYGCDIYMKEVYAIDPNAILRVHAKNSVTIDGSFYIDEGCVLEIKPDY